MAHPLASSLAPGRLLVASSTLLDPHFRASLVLLLAYDEAEGAMGVILNDCTHQPVAVALPGWESVLDAPACFFTGGPVDAASALGVAYTPTGAVSMIDLEGYPLVEMAGYAGARIYLGYSGWGAGQLEAEIAEGSWHVVRAELDDLCSPDPASLWSRVLRRQPGQLAWLTTLPHDAELN